MSYADKVSLQTRLGTLYSEIYSADTAALADLAAAQAEVDGSLAVRYLVPVTAPDEALALLKEWTLSLAEELAFLRTAGTALPEKVRLRSEEVRARLSEVRSGTFLLPGAEERDSASIVFLSMDRPVFGRDTMKRF